MSEIDEDPSEEIEAEAPPERDLRLEAELAELFHTRGLHLPTRTLYLGPSVDDKSARRLVSNLHVLESLGVEPVTLLINNSGGDDYNCLAIFDAIKQSPLHVTGLVRGSAMSAASIVLQACDWRKMGPLATQLVHYGSFGYQGHALDAQRAIDEGKRVNEWMENMYLARVREKQPDYALEKLRELLRFDSYLTAEQSVALGLADEVS